MKLSFVVGNGISRRDQPLERLVEHGTVYACNYAVLDVPCDHGIAVDRGMLFDLLSQHQPRCTLWSRAKWCSVLAHATPVYPLPDQLYPPVSRWDAERHWGSGTHAVWKAAESDSDIVVLIGFDLWNSGINNNLYANRPHYNNRPVDPACWIYQLKETFARHPNTSFVSIQSNGWNIPESWHGYENFSVDNYSNLWAWLG